MILDHSMADNQSLGRASDGSFVDKPYQIDHDDPHGILPNNFLESWGERNVAAALRAAEEAPSSTPDGELRRCPYCDSIKVRSKPGHQEIPNKRPENHKCGECGEHFDSPADPIPSEQLTLRQS